MASNWLVAGVEAAIQLSTQNTTPTFICSDAICNSLIGDAAPVAAALDRAQKLDWFATVRGRIGATGRDDNASHNGIAHVAFDRTSKARAGRRAGSACHRRWSAYGKHFADVPIMSTCECLRDAWITLANRCEFIEFLDVTEK